MAIQLSKALTGIYVQIGLLLLTVGIALPASMANDLEGESLPLGASALRSHTSHSTNANQSPQQTFDRAWQLIEQHDYDCSHNGQNFEYWRNRYQSKLATHEDAYKAIDTMLASLRHSERQLIKIDHSRFCDFEWKWFPQGIGITLGVDQEKRIIVNSVFANSSAAGSTALLPGDVIAKVDGKPTQGLRLRKVPDLIQGKPDSEVVLSILRKQVQKEVKVRRNWKHSAIGATGMLEPDIGYINIATTEQHHFVEKFREALHSVSDASGIIVDLRGASLGSPDVLRLCNLFRDEEVIVCYSDRDGLHKEITLHPAEYRGRLVLLINESTGGTVEFLCESLKHNQRAVLVGEPTKSGLKAVISFFPINDDFFFHLDTGEYLKPDGSPLGQGVCPDEIVELTQVDYESGRGPWWYSHASLPRSGSRINDIQLKRAIEVLKTKV